LGAGGWSWFFGKKACRAEDRKWKKFYIPPGKKLRDKRKEKKAYGKRWL